MCCAKTVTCQNFSAFWIKFLGYQKRSKSWNVYLIKKLCYHVFSKNWNVFPFFSDSSFKEMANEASFQLWQNGNISKKLTFVSLEGKNVWYCAKYRHNVAKAFIISHSFFYWGFVYYVSILGGGGYKMTFFGGFLVLKTCVLWSS